MLYPLRPLSPDHPKFSRLNQLILDRLLQRALRQSKIFLWWFRSAVSEDPNTNYQSYEQGFFQPTGGSADASPACEWFDEMNDTNNQCEQNYFHEEEPIRVHSPQNNVRCTSTPNTNQYEQAMTTNEPTNAVDQLIDDFTMGGGENLESDLDQFYSQDFDSLFSLTG